MRKRLKQELDFHKKMVEFKTIVRAIDTIYKKVVEESVEELKTGETSKYEILLGVIKCGRKDYDFVEDVLDFMKISSEELCDKLFPWIEGGKPLVSLSVGEYLVQFGYKED